MSGKTRVFVSLNGDYEGTPTIVIVKEGMSFEEFLGKCASKLKVEKKLSRVFYIKNGAEIDDPDDLMPEDKIFVSEGEDYKQKPTGMLSGGLTAIAGVSSSAYSVVTTFAKSKMSEDMRKKFEETEANVAAKLKPVVDKTKEVTAPAVNWADSKLDVASNTIKEKHSQFMASETGKYLQEKAGELNTKIVKPAAAKTQELYITASSELKKMGKEGKQKMVPFTEYMTNVKEKMGKEYDEKLAPALKNMYQQAKVRASATQEAVKAQTQQMQKAWKEQVEPLIKEKLGKKDSGSESNPVLADPLPDPEASPLVN